MKTGGSATVASRWVALLLGGWIVGCAAAESEPTAEAGGPAFEAQGAAGSEGEDQSEVKPAKMRVRGHGLLGNRRLLLNLRVLQPEEGAPEFLDAATIEDAAVLLRSALRGEGYLRPRLDVEIHLPDGTWLRYPSDDDSSFVLPLTIAAREVRFTVHRGVFYTFRNLEFEGLTALPDSAARGFFLVEDYLIPQRGNRIFTQNRLDRGLANLREELILLGHVEAEVTVKRLVSDEVSGQVDVLVNVVENRLHRVTELTVGVVDAQGDPVAPAVTRPVGETYSPRWEQRLVRDLKEQQYREGYPDTEVVIESETRAADDAERALAVKATVLRGERIKVGRITYDGLTRTRESVARRRTRFTEGDPLNPLRVEESRFQMLRLGVFDRVDVEYAEMDDPSLREVRYTVQQAKPIRFSVLLGYGSYELLRGGVEFEQLDLFGLAHRHRLQAVQSFKSTKVEYGYTIPQAFDAYGDLSSLIFFRERQETTFTRRDYGGSVGYFRTIAPLWLDAGLRYNFERLQTEQVDFNPAFGLQRANASSIGLTLDHNRRDNPLYPSRGYRIYATAEWASDLLGGGANFERFELGGGVHLPLSHSLTVHLGGSHAVVLTPGDVSTDLPFNRRYFLGGANSVRGYTQGEAASLDDDGRIVGDEATLLGHVELEQRLTTQWSVVGFLDAAGLARDLADYPASEFLVSVGAGIRFRSPAGPVRLEYGHNLNPRADDAAGTLHFSIGYPF